MPNAVASGPTLPDYIGLPVAHTERMGGARAPVLRQVRPAPAREPQRLQRHNRRPDSTGLPALPGLHVAAAAAVPGQVPVLGDVPHHAVGLRAQPPLRHVPIQLSEGPRTRRCQEFRPKASLGLGRAVLREGQSVVLQSSLHVR